MTIDADRCVRCSLIFDAEPKEIGRGHIDKTICIICEGTMQVITHQKTVNVHTLEIDDAEVQHFKEHPNEWIILLNDIAVPSPVSTAKRGRVREGVKKAEKKK